MLKRLDTEALKFFTLVELVPNTWTQLHLDSEEATIGIFPLENATTHTHTHSIPLYGNAITHAQPSKIAKIPVWTWVSTSQAYKTSFNWRCSKHILIILPDICISAHRIKQIKLQAKPAGHTLPQWLETQESKRKYSKTEEARKAPKSSVWVVWTANIA